MRQIGSHIRLRSNVRGHAHSVTVPEHSDLCPGTLTAILSDVAEYLGVERTKLAQELFDK
jgi:predicted RNA binding protein YcfA (HicA-like mRNA interferase family)